MANPWASDPHRGLLKLHNCGVPMSSSPLLPLALARLPLTPTRGMLPNAHVGIVRSLRMRIFPLLAYPLSGKAMIVLAVSSLHYYPWSSQSKAEFKLYAPIFHRLTACDVSSRMEKSGKR